MRNSRIHPGDQDSNPWSPENSPSPWGTMLIAIAFVFVALVVASLFEDHQPASILFYHDL